MNVELKGFRGGDRTDIALPEPQQRLLDSIVATGKPVTGIDSSPAMVEEARRNFPGIRFEVHDVCTLPFDAEFDGLFSNAVLHWVTRAEEAVAAMARALKAGGRLVAEFGGQGNTQALLDASDQALAALGVSDPASFHPWYYPSIEEYTSLLERHGFDVTFATLFDRPTPLEGGEEGLATWLRMFGARLAGPLAKEQLPEYHRLTGEFASPKLKRDGVWIMDYRRLRIVARRIPA